MTLFLAEIRITPTFGVESWVNGVFGRVVRQILFTGMVFLDPSSVFDKTLPFLYEIC
jgi:hypothetical protein